MLLQYDEESQTILQDNKHSVQAKVFYFPSDRGEIKWEASAFASINLIWSKEWGGVNSSPSYRAIELCFSLQHEVLREAGGW